ncbi:SDR family oxidoreductase [Candidatus Fermentibacteria bacterium]|nr:SDR family oxidoreductase [Candidatus Fermentibacteria bacterium]
MIIVTGASGFLGTHIVAELLQKEMPILALVRAAPGRAEARLARAWWDWPELAALIGSRIQACPGDITMPDLGLSSTALSLARNATHVVHAAADIRLAAPLDELLRMNRDGTARMLEFATSLPGLSHFVHVSTAYVAGMCPGPVTEENLSDAYGFRSPYEMSKYEGEQLVRTAMTQMPITVARPGMVVGHSETGAVKTFNTLYLPLRLFLSGRLPVIPARASLRLPMVPVDYVARSVASLLLDPRAMGATVHLVSPTDACPSAAALLTTVQGWARKNLGLRLRRPLFVPLPLPRRLKTWRMSDPPTGKLRALLPYVEAPVFRRDTADRLLGPYPHDWRSLVPPMLSFAVNYGFLHRSERTVQEQVMFRLGRSFRPVSFHDVVEGRARTRRGPMVRQDIEKVRHSLCAMGVGRGHTVAIIGPNSTRYVTIDVAIGLAGAVSVPLHPATPANELRSLLGSSEVRLLFIGCPVMEGGLEGLGIPVVSFTDAPPRDQAILSWEQFLARGAHGDAVPMVCPHDPATRRHTSGTTGSPQGVVFNHRNVRWMAECLASLFPWHWRIRPARYLSFLPMNHVVEGILATYAPYYLPAPVDIYFLDDIHELPRALRVARPTVFFSVPRFYEKVWAAFSSRPAGRWYCGHSRSVAAKLARPLLRRALLGRVGLHRCRYLIAGSAASDHGLLCGFQELGIEIHDAYPEFPG